MPAAAWFRRASASLFCYKLACEHPPHLEFRDQACLIVSGRWAGNPFAQASITSHDDEHS